MPGVRTFQSVPKWGDIPDTGLHRNTPCCDSARSHDTACNWHLLFSNMYNTEVPTNDLRRAPLCNWYQMSKSIAHTDQSVHVSKIPFWRSRVVLHHFVIWGDSQILSFFGQILKIVEWTPPLSIPLFFCACVRARRRDYFAHEVPGVLGGHSMCLGVQKLQKKESHFFLQELRFLDI